MALSNRVLWTVLALVPVAVMTERTAAADSSQPLAAQALPHGVHLGKSGRFYQDVCDHDEKFHCMSQRVLPDSYTPGDFLKHVPWKPGSPSRTPEVPGGGNSSSGPPDGTLAPSDVVGAYSIPSSRSCGGKVVAVADMPYTNALSDLNAYRQAFGIAPLAQCSGTPTGSGTPCFAVADENGKLNPTGLQDGGSADDETALDMDMISAAAPDCSILLVEFSSEDGPTDTDFVNSAAAARKLNAVATSISWGGVEGGSGSDPTGYTQPGKMLVLAAGGDSGYLQESGGREFQPFGPEAHGSGGQGGTPSYPASSPDVLGVGGTNLEVTTTGYSETVWDDSSGATTSGCSTEFPIPSFQSTFLASHADAFGSCQKRATVDVAAAAEFTPSGNSGGGIAIYVDKEWESVVGTSAASPEVAAILTRLGLALDVSNDLGFVYDHIADFNDVTEGSNGSCGTVLCTAGTGWDGPTGVGTPDGSKLAALSGGASTSGSSSSSSGSSSGSGSTGSSSGGATSSSSGSASDTSGSGSSSSSSSGGIAYDGGEGAGNSPGGSSSGASSNGAGGDDDFGGSSGSGCSATPGNASNPLGIAGLLGIVVGVLGRRRRK